MNGEEHDGRTPERPETRLGRECARSLMLVRINEVIVRRVVQEDKTEPNREASDGRAYPVHMRVRRPCEDEEANRDEPARVHHGDETGFGGRRAIVFAAEVFVVRVDEGGECGAQGDTEGDGDEHEACDAGAVVFSFLVDDGEAIRIAKYVIGDEKRMGYVRDEEHVEEAVEDRHVQRDQEDDEFGEEKLERPEEVDLELFGERFPADLLLGDVSRVAGFFTQTTCSFE